VGGKKSFENSQIQESKNLQISQNSEGSKIWKIQKSQNPQSRKIPDLFETVDFLRP
jgi:hypothetical protein